MATESPNAAESAAEASTGMPQLDFSTFGNQIFWLLVALVAIYLLLSRVALPRIAAILAERKGTITNDLVIAKDLKAAAVKAEEAYEKALTDARAEAQKIAAQTKAGIQAEVDQAIAQADSLIAEKAAESEMAIAEIRAGAMASVKTVANDTAAEILSALGRSGSADEVAKAVAAQLEDRS